VNTYVHYPQPEPLRELRKIGCVIPVEDGFLKSAPDAEGYIRRKALKWMEDFAAANGGRVLPGSLRESHRETVAWFPTGELDADGEPVRELRRVLPADDEFFWGVSFRAEFVEVDPT
jgi:hypothetical protein